MRWTRWTAALALLALVALCAPLYAQTKPVNDGDQTLRALRDEMARSKTRLELKIPGTAAPVRPFYVAYRLLDLDIKTVSAEFGALVSSTTTRNRFMAVEARVGDYKLDSSNFVSDEGFRGFIGSTGGVGIDRDYDSLRQDLWIATDQAFKEAVETFSRKRAYLSSLARQSEIPDFSRETPVVSIEPRLEPDWSPRNWEQEARQISAVLRAYPQLYSTRVSCHLVNVTQYLFTSEGTEIRTSRSLAAIEAGLDTLADDGMPLHHFYASYAPRSADLPSVDAVRKSLNVTATELMALRAARPAEDYTGPVLFEARAAAPLVAQILGPNLNGARPPLAFAPVMEQLLNSLGGKSDWVGRLGARVLPATVALVDDPSAKDFRGHTVLGGYVVDEEGVKAQKVTLVENGVLKNELMSRRPGPDFDHSNGHGRAAFLNDARPTMSNLFFTSSDAVSPQELRKRFLDKCREEKLSYCLVVREMDNPALSISRQDDFSELLASLAGGAGSGDRLPLLAYKVYPEDGHEELVRGGRIIGLNSRSLRNLAGIGNDSFAWNFMESQEAGFAGTALGAFGSARGGLPAAIVAPSLLFDEVEVRGARGEPKRLPLLPAPQLTAAK
ncbi:MAG: hypothetical protein AUI53_05780 [Acidobacteria bacterium 13_1_40CM_2_60_7]|nr:MAG: hypothetical protein AUH88_07135 [Acidobacteria bacterium 13_1_40CM_4_61_5]OLD61423.1 MAG: hypothetical protein AUI53_05780 [Acidobacteria bacterium 13_1_40CM_2_60_7]